MSDNLFTVETSDGLALHARSWPAEGEPRGVVVIVHGLGEHSGRYEHVAAALGAAGYETVAYDQRGHGRSEGPRGHTPRYEQLLDDLDALLLRFSDDDDGRSPPVFLYGHSLGGGVVLNRALRGRHALAGVVASSPLLRTTEPPPAWKVHVAKTLRRVWPTLAFTVGIDPAARSHDPRVAPEYAADPLTHGVVSAGLGVEMIQAGRRALENAAELTVPTLLMHGDADPVTCPAAAAEFASAAEPCTLRIWPGKLHELHWEDNRDAVLGEVVGWLEKCGS